MLDFLARLSAVPPRCHSAANVTDEEYDRQLRDLIVYLKEPGVIQSGADINENLDAIDPSIHSLSFLHLLRYQIRQVQKRTRRDIPDDLLPGGILWKHAVRFLRSFDPVQVRYAGHEWRQLIELMASAAQDSSKARRDQIPRTALAEELILCVKQIIAFKVIRESLNRLNSSRVFTSVHLVLVKLALLTSSYTYALPIVDELISHFPTDTEHVAREKFLCSEHESSAVLLTEASGFSTKLSYRDHLLFFLYSAMLYMALKRWDEASHCLCAVISSPTTNSVSKIMVEAYKKLLLVNLLGHGKLLPAPKLVAAQVTRLYQALARPYISIAEAFETGDLEKLRTEINLGQSTWRADKNTGLVLQLFEAYDRFVVMKLGKTFSAVTVQNVLRRASFCTKGPLVIEEFVSTLVMSKGLRATLSQSSTKSLTMLRFSPRKQSLLYQEERIRKRLVRGRSALNAIAAGIAQTDQVLELSQENLQFLAKNRRWNANAEKLGTVDTTDGGASGDVDEDLMGEGS
ncbi:hypothetical protein BJX70DRAFT_392851 [Aspergillus crustosus]